MKLVVQNIPDHPNLKFLFCFCKISFYKSPINSPIIISYLAAVGPGPGGGGHSMGWDKNYRGQNVVLKINNLQGVPQKLHHEKTNTHC